ncbi:hypothetical protein [Pseudomonas syringae]|uniref:hypothetical protein n=1 Tax=Pseudomonas syringae TaxID=317 RepID=UPI000E31A362|nr:hypothetical protein [Pseudomonas syringae]
MARLVMTLEESRALDDKINKRYPTLKDTQRSISLSKKDPWQGIITFYHANGYSDTAVFNFKMSGRDGMPSLYIERDWND